MNEVEKIKEELRLIMNTHRIKVQDILVIVINICKLLEKSSISVNDRKRIALEVLQSIIPADYYNANFVSIIIDNVVLLGLHNCPKIFCCC